MHLNNIRLPAEWEKQDGILLAWPHKNTDWKSNLAVVQALYRELACLASQDGKVMIVAPCAKEVINSLETAGYDSARVSVYELPTNDTWIRDYGPLTVEVNGSPVLLDFGFNGWGLKFAADHDNLLTRRLKELGAFIPRVNTVGLVLEGGSVESDGRGIILTTARCLLSTNRNPQLDMEEIEGALASLLGVRKVLWLKNGYLAGDDTDSHIDTLARLCPENTILYQSCDDPDDEHFQALMEMKNELSAFTNLEDNPFRLIPLPWPGAKYDEEGNRLPASYANFLITNNSVLVPLYSDPSDDAAIRAISMAFPGREIKGLNCLPLIRQHGSLHCVTMQLPKGVLE